MASIKREIETLRAKILRLEKEQKKAEQQQKALDLVQGQIDKTLKEGGLTFEAYVRSNYTQISRIIAKIEKEKARSAAPVKQATKKKAVSKKRSARKTKTTIKIPAGSYCNLPADPERVFEVKEKGPRPKALKAYAEEVGLEAFLAQCRKEG
jgi:septal ring factor EnvC (AmiA/AmiB activator)